MNESILFLGMLFLIILAMISFIIVSKRSEK